MLLYKEYLINFTPMKRYTLLVAISLSFSVSASVTLKPPTEQTEKFKKESCFEVSTNFYVSDYSNDINMPVAVLEQSITIESAKVFTRDNVISYKNPAIAKRLYLLNRNIKIC